MPEIRDFVVLIIGILMAITVHECAHAWSADKLGDSTARLMGRVSLNPLKQLDPVGTIMIIMSAISGYGIGWGKPTPVLHPERLKYGPRTGMALVAVAGPASNLLLAFILMLPVRLGLDLPYVVAYILVTFAFVNVVLSVFNLIPLPPLDGFSVLVGILGTIKSRTMYGVNRFLDQVQNLGFIPLLVVLSVGWVTGYSLIGKIMDRPIDLLWKLVGG